MTGNEELYSVACMYGGFSVVLKSNLEFTTLYNNSIVGESLLYGISSKHINDRKYHIATCTFNDKNVSSYEVDLKF